MLSSRWILRVACIVLLGVTLTLPELAAGLGRRAAGETGCRCSNHSCCGRGSTVACPLSRGGKGCARSRTPATAGLRAACDCSPNGKDAALSWHEPALPPGRRPALESSLSRAGWTPCLPIPVSSLHPTPDPPPPRAALHLA